MSETTPKRVEMTQKMKDLLAYLHEHSSEQFVPLPQGSSLITVKKLERKDWIVTNETRKGLMARITGRGVVALRVASVYYNTRPEYVAKKQQNGVKEDPAVVEEAEVVAVQQVPEAQEAAPVMVIEGFEEPGCVDGCGDCPAARILGKLKSVNPKLSRLINAMIEAEMIIEEMGE